MPSEGKRKSDDRCRERSGWCKDDKSRKRSCSRSPGTGHRDTKRRSSKHGVLSDSRRLSCRLFIGNLPKGTRKADLVEFFNHMLRKSGICQGPADPVEDCYVVRDQFAFIQCRTVEEMTVALSFNGCNFNGNSLKIERPLGQKESAGMYKAKPFRGGVLINPWATTPDPSTKESHTLWIWNIPIGVLGEKVAEFFNNLMIISGFAKGPGESVVNCRVTLGKEYCTLENQKNPNQLGYIQMQYLKTVNQKNYQSQIQLCRLRRRKLPHK
ncbi:splicing factor U2AF 50 kDa subunit [Anabrus simplex]|uniref:splicing factor U2AF 50 kDa subunit n=1 Tax=Anabrus simplex TaxID=316456 RepID=UPI0035A2E7A7